MGDPATDGGLYLWQLRRAAADGDVPVYDAATGRFFPNPPNAGQPCACLDAKITIDVAASPVAQLTDANWITATAISLTNSVGAAATIQGLNSEGGAPTVRDRILLMNVDAHGTDPFLFSHLDAAAAANDRMYFPTVAPAATGTFMLSPGEALLMFYDRVNGNLWRPF